MTAKVNPFSGRMNVMTKKNSVVSKKENPFSKKSNPYSNKEKPETNGIGICPYIALEDGHLLKTEDDSFILTYI